MTDLPSSAKASLEDGQPSIGADRWQQLSFPLLLAAAGAAALAVDVPLARIMVKGNALRSFDQVLETIEPFGHAFAVLLVVLAIGACDLTKRWALPRMLAAAIGAGIAADVFKLLVWRIRPYHFEFEGTVFSTFRGILPGTSAGSGGQSCPSAHVATAVGFCLALNALFPQGRRFFIGLAGLVALQRIAIGAHYLSDTLWGAAVGYLFCACLYRNNAVGRWFDRWEDVWRSGRRLAALAYAAPSGRVPSLENCAGSALSARFNPEPTATACFLLENTAGSAQYATAECHRERSLPAATYRKVSVVIPVYNECESIRRMHDALAPVLGSLAGESEVVFVDDGSDDGTAQELAAVAHESSLVRVVTLRRNFGQTAALAAGIQCASGDVIVMLDGDLQNDPADIPMLLHKLDEGFDLVQGWRRQRQDRLLDRRLPSTAANWLISKVTRFPVHDIGCTLKAIRADIARDLPLYGEMHRFIPILAHARGARCTEVVTRHHPRRFGMSKSGISRTPRVLLDLLTVAFLMHYADRPMQLLGKIGLVCTGLATASGAIAAVRTILERNEAHTRPLVFGAVLLILFALQFFCLGLLGELAVRRGSDSFRAGALATIRRRQNIVEDDAQPGEWQRAA